jgi:hypothetical protein
MTAGVIAAADLMIEAIRARAAAAPDAGATPPG